MLGLLGLLGLAGLLGCWDAGIAGIIRDYPDSWGFQVHIKSTCQFTGALIRSAGIAAFWVAIPRFLGTWLEIAYFGDLISEEMSHWISFSWFILK
ncbi:hypothetical protein DFP94_10868 [Fontibacillus phaseoli]|uniref:Uncharacterized protein n=1 Tax=Fontibacillus phaseoli TaxID=1416533 RepID=A0A369B859_9BACL|nr:hypothetical protein DFP94_10868 [Fontibacillus phaseoli]